MTIFFQNRFKPFKKRWFRIFFAVILLLQCFSAPAYCHDPAILIIHSYHQEYPWTRGQNNSFVQSLEADTTLHIGSFYTEYLDTKRLSFTREYQEFFYRYLKEKYQGFEPDLIYCTDDNALHFIHQYLEELFPSSQVVFSGVNNLQLQSVLDKRQFRGIYEKKEIAPNLSFLRKMIPDLKTVYFVGDTSTTYRAIQEEAEKEITSLFPQFRYEFISENKLSTLLDRVKSLQDGVVVLTTIGGFFDDQNSLVPLDTVISNLQSTVMIPIVSMEDAYVRDGVLGGYVTSSRAQGEAAALLAAKLLKGEAPETVASKTDSPNAYIFNYAEISRFGIPVSHLPDGSEVINQPQTFFYMYKKRFLAMLTFVALQFVIIFFLIKNIFSRRRAEEALTQSHERLELKVAERTADLQRANIRLEKEAVERRTAEEKLRLQGEQLSAVIKNLPVVLWVVDDKGIFTLSTGKGLEQLGLTEGQFVGTSLFDQYNHNKNIIRDVRKAFAGEECSSIIAEAGLIFESHYSPLVSEGKITGVIGLAIDVSERVSMERQLRQSQKMEAIGTLAGGIAHDFNNILQWILGYAELARDQINDHEYVRSSLDRVIDGAKRARDLVHQILTFSRKRDETLDPISPAPVIKETLKLLRASIPTSINIVEEINGNCGAIMADATSLNQLVMNLCANALQAMENQEGVLTVSMDQKELDADDLIADMSLSTGLYVKITVKDTGKGMDKETISRIFEPYFTTKEVGKGTGMGLAMVHGIVNRLGGMIRVESAPGEGATFSAYFPVIATEAIGTSSVDEKILQVSPRGTERIMCVDDEVAIVRLQQATLERLGYSVTSFVSSRDALEAFRKNPQSYDLLITDQTMPEFTGKKLAEQILEIRPEFPIIMNTGYSAVISEAEAKEIGIKAFAMKPLDAYQLAMLVRQTLDA